MSRPAVAVPPSLASPPEGGLHPVEWGCELAGTFVLVLGGLSAVCLDFGRGSPMPHLVPSSSLRLLITGALFAGCGSLVAISPLGRRSGAHLNPCVTAAFWVTGHVSGTDLGGYLASQFAGAVLGTLALVAAWGPVAASVRDAATLPSPGVGPLQAVGIEALMTGILVLTLLAMTSVGGLVRLTPLALWVVIAVLVWRGAPYTGCSLNPARSLGPALVGLHLQRLWVYFLGPIAGALLAAYLFRLLGRGRLPLTAKLYHDIRFPSVLATSLPHRLREELS